jgi:hypothetical protein
MDMYGVAYAETSPNYFDGISEYACGSCGARYGRWTRKKLEGDTEEQVWGGKPIDPEEELIPEPSNASPTE